MITIKLSPFKEIDSIVHISTSYRIAKDSSGIVILDEALEDKDILNKYPNLNTGEELKNSKIKNLYLSPLKGNQNTVYYASFNRHLYDPLTGVVSETGWSSYKPMKLRPNIEGKELIVKEDIVIETPMVYITKESLDINKETLIIKTSKFRSNLDGHYATHYILTDIFGNVLYCKLEDKVNLTELILDIKNLNLDSKSQLVIKVIHVGTSTRESSVGTNILVLDDFNFEITSSLQRLIPYSNYNVKIKNIDPNLPNRIVKLDLYNIDSEEPIYQKDINEETNVITIPGEMIEPDRNYYLDIIAIGSNNNLKRKRKLMTSIPTTNKVYIDHNFIYKNTLTLVNTVPKNNVECTNLSLHETFNNKVPAPMIDSLNIYKGEIVNYELTFNEVYKYPTISLVTTDNDDVYIRMLENNILLIDSYINNKPTFSVYKYDSHKETLMLLNVFERSNENKCLGYNNSLVYEKDSITYIPFGFSSICNYNYITNEFTTLDITLPITSDKGIIMFKVDGNRYCVMGSESENAYNYNINEKNFTISYPVPEYFRNKILRTVPLINGDVLIYRLENTIEDTESKLLRYSMLNNLLLETDIDIAKGLVLDTSIVLTNGKILFVSNGGENKKYFIYE